MNLDVGTPHLKTSGVSSNYHMGGDEIDVVDIGRTILMRWRTIAAITAFVALIAMYLALTAYPQFTVNGALYLGDAPTNQNPASGQSDNITSAYENVSNVQTQAQLIQSKEVVERAIMQTGLNASIRPVGQTNLTYWRWYLNDSRAVQAFAPQSNDLDVQYATLADPGSRGAGYTVIFGANGTYRLVTGGGWFHSAKTVLTGTLNQGASGGGVSLLIKAADGQTIPKGSEYKLSITPAKSLADSLLGGALTVNTVGDASAPTQIASVQLKWGNPYKGQEFVNTLMADYIATQLAWRTQSASSTEDFVSGQLQKITAALDQANQGLAAYQSQTGIVDVPANAQAVITQLSQYETQRTSIFLQQQSLQQLLQSMSKKSGSLEPFLVNQANDPVLSQLAGDLADADVKLQTLRVQFTGQSDEVAAQQATVSRLQSAIRTLISNDASLAAKNLSNIDALIANYQQQLKSMPAQSLKVISLTRSSDVLGQLYILLMQKQQEAEISKAATIVNTRVVTPAEVPLYATAPKPEITILAGIFIGAFLGLLLVLTQRAFSGRFQSEAEIRQTVALPVYALIPQRTLQEERASIFPLQVRGPYSEVFRLLRGNLYQRSRDHKSRIILLTSVTNHDGRTAVAANLAKSMADDGRRVVLVNADLHCDWAYKPLGATPDSAPGLSDWLMSGTKPTFHRPDRQAFYVLNAGSSVAHPSELLNAYALRNIFDTLRQEFEFVIIDVPPLPAVSDGLALAYHADIILSVVHILNTSRRGFALQDEALSGLNRHRGIIINGVVMGSAEQPYGASTRKTTSFLDKYVFLRQRGVT